MDEKSKQHSYPPDGSYREHLQVYYDQRYGRQKERIQQYFSEVEGNLQQLVSQTGFFHL